MREAADLQAADGISAEVVDPRTFVPLDLPIPFSRPMEAFVEPTVYKIVTAARLLLG